MKIEIIGMGKTETEETLFLLVAVSLAPGKCIIVPETITNIFHKKRPPEITPKEIEEILETLSLQKMEPFNAENIFAEQTKQARKNFLRKTPKKNIQKKRVLSRKRFFPRIHRGGKK